MAQCFEFTFGYVAHFQNLTDEMQVLACVWMVEIDGYFVVSDLYHLRFYDLSIGCVHRNDSPYLYALVVKYAIDDRDVQIAVQNNS